MFVDGPPDASTFLSLPPAKKAMNRLSGDQNGGVGDPLISMLAIVFGVNELSERTQSKFCPSCLAFDCVIANPPFSLEKWAIVERNHSEPLPPLIPDLLRRANDIRNLGSRSEAIFLLFSSSFPCRSRELVSSITSAARGFYSPDKLEAKTQFGRCGNDSVGVKTNSWREIIDGLTDTKLKTKLGKMSATKKAFIPRPFFWTTAGYSTLDRSGDGVSRK